MSLNSFVQRQVMLAPIPVASALYRLLKVWSIQTFKTLLKLLKKKVSQCRWKLKSFSSGEMYAKH